MSITNSSSLLALLSQTNFAGVPNHVYLATVTMTSSSKQISYQLTVPDITLPLPIYGIYPSSLVSASKFYLVASLNQLLPSQTGTSISFSQQVGVILSSDDTESCMTSLSASTPIVSTLKVTSNYLT